MGDQIEGKSTGEFYDVGKELGRGGFGAAFLVTRLSDGVEFVAKEAVDSSEVKKRKIEQEYDVIKKLNAKAVPYVPEAIEMSEFMDNSGGIGPVFIMSKAPGSTLKDLIRTGGLDETQCHDITHKIAESVAGIHAAGYIHRDLSPDNIFVDDLGGKNDITIIDFGIAAIKADSKTFGLVSLIAGKAFFAPPEQTTSDKVSIGNDIFGVGATAFALLCGWPKIEEYLQKNRTPQPAWDVHLEDSTVASHFRDVIMRSTWKDRSGRFATMQDLVDALGGRIPDESLPRIVADGKVYVLTGDGPWLIGRANHIADIDVEENTMDALFISREHAIISRRNDGILILQDGNGSESSSSLNGTRIHMPNGRWIEPPEQGIPLGARYCEIALGYSTVPPDAKDLFGNKLMPGPYKVVEFFPPKSDSGTLLNTSP